MLERLWSASELLWTPTAASIAQGRADFGLPSLPQSVFLVQSPRQPLAVLQVETPPKSPTQRKKHVEKSSDYFANVGDAIRTLREDIPMLFQKDLNYEIYRDDIIFRDPRNMFQGMKNYQTIFWSLQFHGKLFFTTLYVEVKRIWQPDDSQIKMRWTVHGVPRVPWEAEGLFDGVSSYRLDHQGKIYEHSVDNVLLRDPPMAMAPNALLSALNLVPTTQGQTPVPGAWFRPIPLGVNSSSGTGPAVQAAVGMHSSFSTSAAGGASHASLAAAAAAGTLAVTSEHAPQQQWLQALALQLRWSTVRLFAASLAAAASAELLQATAGDSSSQPSVAGSSSD